MDKDIWRRIDDSWAHYDHVRHPMYEGICQTLQEFFNKHPEWKNRLNSYIEFGAAEPTTSIIRIVAWLIGRDQLSATVVSYPDVDLQKTEFDDQFFDITVADQVLEHVERPWLASEELWRITKRGGLTVVATPFIHPIHNAPIDCWRIAPRGYQVLFPWDKWDTLTLSMWGWRELIAWEYASPVTKGLSGEWLNVSEARKDITGYDTRGTDYLNPIVIWYIAQKK